MKREIKKISQFFRFALNTQIVGQIQEKREKETKTRKLFFDFFFFIEILSMNKGEQISLENILNCFEFILTMGISLVSCKLSVFVPPPSIYPFRIPEEREEEINKLNKAEN